MTIAFAAILIGMGYHYGLASLGTIRHDFFGGYARGGFGFLAGVLLFRLKQSRRLPSINVHWLVLFVALPTAVAVADIDALDTLWYPDFLIVGIGMPLLCWAGIDCQLPHRLHGPANFLGALSYPIYAVHLPIINLGRHFDALYIDPTVPKFVIGFSWFVVALIVSWIAMRFFDNPLQKWFKVRASERSLPTTF